jgi:hypothetical protein
MTLAALAAAASSSNDVEPGVLGFLVVAAMGVALVFLLRSMNKQFRKIEPEPEAPDGEQAGEQAKTPAQTPE